MEHHDSSSPSPSTRRDNNDDSSNSLVHHPPSEGDSFRNQDQTFIEEKEMGQKLMEMESSFLPAEPSTIQVPSASQSMGLDDSFASPEKTDEEPTNTQISFVGQEEHQQEESALDLSGVPAPSSSSPAAAAAARNVHTIDTASPQGFDQSNDGHNQQQLDDFSQSQEPADSTLPSMPLTVRPKVSSQQSFSITSSNTENTNSEATLGFQNRTSNNDMARSFSLGSIESGISGFGDENPLEKRNASVSVEDGGVTGLQTLDEEETPPPNTENNREMTDDSAPVTPKAPRRAGHDTSANTAITGRIRGAQFPGDRGMSPSKRTSVPTPGFTRSGHTMTLKEQSSTIDRLSKENFDLKMRIHFMNEALDKRSEEGVKEVVSENVELKSDKINLQKQNHGLRRRVRDMEKQLKEKESDKGSIEYNDPDASEDDDRDQGQQEENLFLRGRLDSYEMEIEKLRSDIFAKESEKRRMAEVVRSLSESRGAISSDVGAREERVRLYLSVIF